jgi:hypothetical protein
MRAYIEVPPAPKFLSAQQPSQRGKKVKSKPSVVSHGSKGRTEIYEEDDLGGFGPEEDSPQKLKKTSLSITEAGSSSTSTKRTGDRDDRGDTPLYLGIAAVIIPHLQLL